MDFRQPNKRRKGNIMNRDHQNDKMLFLSFMISKTEIDNLPKHLTAPSDLFFEYLKSQVPSEYWYVFPYAIKHNDDGSRQYLWCNKRHKLSKKYINKLKEDGWDV
jgi:hypothetical protein